MIVAKVPNGPNCKCSRGVRAGASTTCALAPSCAAGSLAALSAASELMTSAGFSHDDSNVLVL